MTAPHLSARVSPEVVASTLARLVASGEGASQADLVRVTGLARSTVTNGLDTLHACGVIRTGGLRPTPGRGRPADRLDINPGFGVILVADIGTQSARLSIHDLGQHTLAAEMMPVDLSDEPAAVLELISVKFEELFRQLPRPHGPARVLVVGLPGPVDVQRGVPVKPPIMPGWDGFPVSDFLSERLGCPTLVENDVNLRALGEARALPVDQSPLLYIKVGTGIGGGLITVAGELHRGADGAAGDIGHVRVPGADHAQCVCGNIGCLESVASLTAMLRVRQAMGGFDSRVPASVEELENDIRAGDQVSLKLVRQSAAMIGEVVVSMVHFFNPARVVIGGTTTDSCDDLLAGIRSVVYRRALPLATRRLSLCHPILGELSGTAGAVVLGIEDALDSATLGAAMRPRFATHLARVDAGDEYRQTIGA